MSDQTPSTLPERLLALPFGVYLGLGALTGVLAVALASLSVDTKPGTTVAAARVDGGGVQDGADVAVRAELGAAAQGVGGAGSAADAAGPHPEPDPNPGQDDGDAAQEDAEEPEAADAESGAGAEAEEEAVEVADSPRDVGSAAEAGDPSSADPDPAVAPPPDPNREAEAAATPEELYDMAKAAYDEGRYRDAYRMATKSQRSKPTDQTQMLRGRSACRIKDEQNAKEIVKSFKLGDERRKTLRTFCKDHGVRVGI